MYKFWLFNFRPSILQIKYQLIYEVVKANKQPKPIRTKTI